MYTPTGPRVFKPPIHRVTLNYTALGRIPSGCGTLSTQSDFELYCLRQDPEWVWPHIIHRATLNVLVVCNKVALCRGGALVYSNSDLIFQEKALSSVDNLFHLESGVTQERWTAGLGDQAEYHQGLHHQLSILWVRKAVQFRLQSQSKF